MHFFMRKYIYEFMIFLRFIFVFLIWMHAKKKLLFENVFINGIFGNTYMMYEILEKCITDFVNAYIDIHKLILLL